MRVSFKDFKDYLLVCDLNNSAEVIGPLACDVFIQPT